MSAIQDDVRKPGIIYACYQQLSRVGEHFVPEHVFSYQIAGTLQINDSSREYMVKEGDFYFYKRNHLAKFTKHPPQNGEYKSISVLLDQDMLRDISMEYGYKAEKRWEQGNVLSLKTNTLYKSFIDSLQPYDQQSFIANKALLTLKIKELVLMLLQANPELKDILFDFSTPGKIDLEAFMQRNFHFNVEMKRFAYLTGRSLATFKRDFEKIFHTSPSRWLQQRRLMEAYYLIKETGKRPGDVYLEVGFEDLSHFSYAFKNVYGMPPSRV